jgi:hypothetical protein
VRHRTPVARIACRLEEVPGFQLVVLPGLGQRGQGLLGGLGGGEAWRLQVNARLCDGLVCPLPRFGARRLSALKGRL